MNQRLAGDPDAGKLHVRSAFLLTMPFLHPDTSAPSRLGGKGAALARLAELGFEIPAWFAVPPEASWTPAELENSINLLGPGLFAVRSSGTHGGRHGAFLRRPIREPPRSPRF